MVWWDHLTIRVLCCQQSFYLYEVRHQRAWSNSNEMEIWPTTKKQNKETKKRCSASESFFILSPCFTRAVIVHLSVCECARMLCSLFWVAVVLGGWVSWDNKTSRVDVFIWKRGQENGKSGEQPGRPGACNKRWRVREWAGERGELFSGHAKEEGAALVTRHVSVTTADTPSPSERVPPRW